LKRQQLVNEPGDRVLDVVDPDSSKIGGVIWSPDGGVASTILSRAEAVPATSGFSTDADRRLIDLQRIPTIKKRTVRYLHFNKRSK